MAEAQRRVMCCACRRVLVAPANALYFKCPACYALMSQKGIKVDEGTAQRVSAGAPDAAVYRPPNNNMAAVQAAGFFVEQGYVGRRVLDVSLGGTFRCVRAALRRLEPGGSIVNVGSVTGHRAERGQAAYAAAKAGVHALTRCAALEAAPRRVRVNAVAPTLAVHPFLERVADPAHLAEMETTTIKARRAVYPRPFLRVFARGAPPRLTDLCVALPC